MRKIFIDDKLNAAFQDKGYVVIPFFNIDEIMKAKEVFEHHALKADRNFYLTIWDNNVPNRLEVHKHLQAIVQPRAKDVLLDYKFLISCFAVKENVNTSSWPLHQDDSFTDESRFESISIWVTLTDVDDDNGAMKVLDGSHNIYKGPRSPTIPKFFSPDDEHLQQQMTTVKMKAGEALIFSHRLLHESGNNTSLSPRIAVVSVLIPDEAPIWFYYNRSGNVEIIRLEEDYYLKFKLGDRPHGVVEEIKPLSELIPAETTLH